VIGLEEEMGWRARLGVVYPADGTLDQEFWQLVPPGVTVHVTRVEVPPEDVDLKLVTDLAESEDIEIAAKHLTIIQPDAIAYACTSASFVRGVGYDLEIISRMEEATGVPATTTSTAAVKALKAVGVKRVAVAAPYVDEINRRLGEFLEGSGFEVVALKGLQAKRGIYMIGSEASYRLAKEVDNPQADGVFISCTALKTLEVLEALEQDLGKPVVTANQATMWESLRLAGVHPHVDGMGQLYRL
jgi:maleate isomerase